MNGRIHLIAAACLLLAGKLNSNCLAVTVDFDNLQADTWISGTDYAGLVWEMGNLGYNTNQGAWKTPGEDSQGHYPASAPNNLTNAWGCTLIGIGFPEVVDVLGANISSQGLPEVVTSAIRVHGYRNGVEVQATDWFTDIDTDPTWFAMNLTGVTRIVIESLEAEEQDAGWYAVDDLTYTPEPATVVLLATGGVLLLQSPFSRKRRPQRR